MLLKYNAWSILLSVCCNSWLGGSSENLLRLQNLNRKCVLTVQHQRICLFRVKIHKEMIVKDDLKKYWGFYLLRGSTVR